MYPNLNLLLPRYEIDTRPLEAHEFWFWLSVFVFRSAENKSGIIIKVGVSSWWCLTVEYSNNIEKSGDGGLVELDFKSYIANLNPKPPPPIEASPILTLTGAATYSQQWRICYYRWSIWDLWRCSRVDEVKPTRKGWRTGGDALLWRHVFNNNYNNNIVTSLVH